MTQAVDRADFDRRGFLIAVVVGTLLSLAMTGQVAGFRNNIFHLPILAGLPDLPQFAADPYVQSLRYYSSGFWQSLHGLAPGHSGLILIDIMALVSRTACIAAFLLCADAIGISRRGERLFFVTLLAFSSLANGYSSAGSHGLFINSFTHSELANASMLLSLWCAWRGRFFGAFAWNGVTFFLNAFMAVWMALPLLAVTLVLVRRGDVAPKALALRMVTGFGAFVLCASPALLGFMGNPELGRPMDHDFLAYLREYFPEHWLIDGSTPRSIAVLLLTATTGIVASWRLSQVDRRAALLIASLAGFIVDWLAGALVPLVAPIPMFINLQFLRGGGGIFLLSALALAALTVVAARDQGEGRRFWAPLLAIGGCTVRHVLPIALLAAVVMRRRLPSVVTRIRLDVAAAIALLLVWSALIVRQARENAVERADIAAWTAIGDWARTHSAPDDRFLIPIANIVFVDPPYTPAEPGQGAMVEGYEVFSTMSERSTFVDVRSGAAALWTPSYYLPWRRRVLAVMALANHDERLAFAVTHRLAYVVDRCGSPNALFEAGGRCVYRAVLPQRRQFAKPYRST
ncbi:hypothetical protein [Sphingomonas montanisoli]|uniref:YfhO family protein n=1 Tax=Sphingomonas montanisoli TaxID=2606412 RepID=A0A5D9CC70_9SPHN|nr:hypothetical protein [Sphingomonas montanisoli]TZG28610.1 hypothetical protein FYJ91_00180 [Sphingomonas montanisoli]